MPLNNAIQTPEQQFSQLHLSAVSANAQFTNYSNSSPHGNRIGNAQTETSAFLLYLPL